MNGDPDIQAFFKYGGMVIVSVIAAIWSYNMFGPPDTAQVAIKSGYVQKIVPTAETGTTTIWVKQ